MVETECEGCCKWVLLNLALSASADAWRSRASRRTRRQENAYDEGDRAAKHRPYASTMHLMSSPPPYLRELVRAYVSLRQSLQIWIQVAFDEFF